MEYIITGSTGFIGSNLLETLLKKKFRKIILINRNSFQKRNIFKNNKIINLSLNEFLKTKINYKNFIFYHLATFYKPKIKEISDIEKTINSNIDFSLEAIIHFKKNNGEKIIYTRSYQELNKNKGLYSLSKITLHEAITTLNFKKYCYVFIYDTYGENDRRNKFLDISINSILNKKPITLEYKNINIYLTSIKDVIRGLLQLKTFNSQGYSLRTNKTITLENIIFKLSKIINKKCVIEYKNNKINEYELPKIKKLKNWNAKYSLDKELSSMIKNRLLNG